MEMELLNTQQSTRSRLQTRIRGHKSDLEKLKRDLVNDFNNLFF
jgi:hypothetical protein